MERQRQKGFTLVEMAIVLVIIGIILAAVMKGRDIIHSGHETQTVNSFMLKWVTMTDDYYKATGNVLNDGQRNGGFQVAANTPDGFMDGYFLTPAADLSWFPTGMVAPSPAFIARAFNTAGINPCFTVKSSMQTAVATGTYSAELTCADNFNPYQTIVDSEYAGKVVMNVGLVNYFLDGHEDWDTTVSPRKNLILFHNVPIDLAIRFDTMVDGRENGRSGKVIHIPGGGVPHNATPTYTIPAAATTPTILNWPRVATDSDRAMVVNVGYILDY